MLQQTRVETVVPYYERFLRRFPSVTRLAAAPLDDVLKQWEGLGYYSRARNLHRAAQHVADPLRGGFPATAAAWRELPGVGRCTAAAIASIAFGEPAAALDGNIKRVLIRLHAMRESPGTRETEARLWRRAAELLAPRSPGDFNQAMMELGATICLPRSPRCDACPLARECRASAQGIAGRLPGRARRPETPLRRFAAVAARRGQRLLVEKRPARGLLGGLWRLPTVPLLNGESARGAAHRLIHDLLRLRPRRIEALGAVEHAFTHFRMRADVYLCELNGRGAEREEPSQSWAAPAALRRLAFATVDRKMLKLLPAR